MKISECTLPCEFAEAKLALNLKNWLRNNNSILYSIASARAAVLVSAIFIITISDKFEV